MAYGIPPPPNQGAFRKERENTNRRAMKCNPHGMRKRKAKTNVDTLTKGLEYIGKT